jgi:hypothetical protein
MTVLPTRSALALIAAAMAAGFASFMATPATASGAQILDQSQTSDSAGSECCASLMSGWRKPSQRASPESSTGSSFCSIGSEVPET